MPGTFIGSNIIGSHGVGSNIFQPIGGGGLLCGFSVYSNGALEVKENFDIRAPLNMNLDYISAIVKSTDISTGTNFFKGRLSIDSSVGTLDSPFAVTSSTTIARIVIQFNTGTQSLTFRWFDDANIEKASIIESPVALDTLMDIEVITTATVFTAIIDGVTFTDSSILGGVCTVDELFIASFSASAEKMPCLYHEFDSSLGGKVSLISNKTDGLNFVSDTGIFYTLNEDSAGASQHPGTGFTWPESTLLDLPAIGEIRMREDALRTTLTAPEDFFGQDWSVWGFMDMQAGNVAGDKVITIGESGVLPTIDVTYTSDTQVNIFIKDDDLVNQFGGNVTIGTYTGKHLIEARFTLSTKALDIYIDGVLKGGITVTSATSLTTDRISLAGHPSLNIQRLDADYFEAGILMSGGFHENWNFRGRLWPENDTLAYSYFGQISGVTMLLDSLSPLTTVFPYPDNNPDQYFLTNDEICEAEGTGFLLNKGIYMQNVGALLTSKPWDPSYTQAAFTGATDTIVVCGDSNSDTDAFPGQTQWPELFAAYCAIHLTGVTVKNIALTGLSYYNISRPTPDYDRVSPNGFTPSLNLVGRPISIVLNNLEKAVSEGATIVVMSAGVASFSNSWTEGAFLAFEDIQMFDAANIYLGGLGIKLIVVTPIAYQSVSPTEATGSNQMALEYREQLQLLGIDYIDENNLMRQGTDFVDVALMRDLIHKNQAGQDFLNEFGIIPGFDRIFKIR